MDVMGWFRRQPMRQSAGTVMLLVPGDDADGSAAMPDDVRAKLRAKRGQPGWATLADLGDDDD